MKIILVSTNASQLMGGEAIKAAQYFRYLLDADIDVHLVTHARCRETLLQDFPSDRMMFVEDDWVQKFMWRSRVFARGIDLYFHLKAANICRRFDPASTIIHYVCPISPIVPRLPPKGFRVVIGPLSGNIFYPPAFKHRAGRMARLQEAIYRPLQRVMGLVFRDKRRASTVLVSGYERTHRALRWAGVQEERMVDVADAGIADDLANIPPAKHEGRNGDFVFVGRLIDLKGADFAIKALARTPKDVRLTIYGKGDIKAQLQDLAKSLGVSDQVDLPGWIPHEQLPERLSRARGFVFPTMCESNGIAMQEAMMIGVPTVCLKWGGPEELADDTQAIFISPDDEETVVAGLAVAMTRLATDPELAAQMGANARARALTEFRWKTVADSWAKSYRGL